MNVTICDDCGLELDEDQLSSCAADPWPWLGVRQHCPSCARDCSVCIEAAAVQWNDEHGIRNGKRH